MLNSKERKFDEQVNKTENLKAIYTSEREVLKRLFYEKFDSVFVIDFLEYLIKSGHPTEQKFAIKFKKIYKSGNIDVEEIQYFKYLYNKYGNDSVVSKKEVGQ